MKTRIRITPEYLRTLARREARYIKRLGWRPRKRDLTQLKFSTRDRIAYLTMMRAWRFAGFKARMIQRLAGR
jgi:hypothetical protein